MLLKNAKHKFSIVFFITLSFIFLVRFNLRAQTFEKISNSACYNSLLVENKLIIAADNGALQYDVNKKNIEQSYLKNYSMIRVFRTDSNYFFITYAKELLITNKQLALIKTIKFNDFIISVVSLGDKVIMTTSNGYLFFYDKKFNFRYGVKSKFSINKTIKTHKYFIFSEKKIINITDNKKYKIPINAKITNVYEEQNNIVCLKGIDSIYVFDIEKQIITFKYAYHKNTNDIKYYNNHLIIADEYKGIYIINTITRKINNVLKETKVNSIDQKGRLAFIATDAGMYLSTDFLTTNLYSSTSSAASFFLKINNDASLLIFSDDKIIKVSNTTEKILCNFNEKIIRYNCNKNVIYLQSKLSTYIFNISTNTLAKKKWGFRVNDFFKHNNGYVIKLNDSYIFTDSILNSIDTLESIIQNKVIIGNLNKYSFKKDSLKNNNIALQDNLFLEKTNTGDIFLLKSSQVVDDWAVNDNKFFYSSQGNIYSHSIDKLREYNKSYTPIIKLNNITPLNTEINAKQQNILIDVLFIDYMYNNNQYYYNLIKDNKFLLSDVKTSDNTLNLFLSEEGKYILQVYTKGYYHNAFKTLSFNIVKPFYLKASFWILLFLPIIIIGTYLLVKYNYQLSKNSILQYSLINSQIKSLLLAMNPHFLYNSLSILKVQVYKNQTDRVINTIDQLSVLLRHNFESLNYTFISIDKEIKLIETYLGVESIRFNYNFNYTIIASSSINLNYYVVPNFILQPIIENYMIHAFKKNEHNDLSIRICEADDLIILRIYMNKSINIDFENIINQNNENSLNYINKRLALLTKILKKDIKFGFNKETSAFFYNIPKLTLSDTEKINIGGH